MIRPAIDTMLSTSGDSQYASFKGSLARIYGPTTYANFLENGISSDNRDIPLWSILHNSGVYKRDNKKIIHYELIDTKTISSEYHYLESDAIKKYDILISNLSLSTMPRRFRTTSMQYELYIMKGMIYEVIDGRPKILFLVSIDSQYVHGWESIPEKLDYSQLKVFMTHEFLNSAKYKSFYKKIYDLLLKDIPQKDIDIVLTNDINSKVFKNDIQTPRFKNIIEMNNYLKGLKTLIFNEERTNNAAS